MKNKYMYVVMLVIVALCAVLFIKISNLEDQLVSLETKMVSEQENEFFNVIPSNTANHSKEIEVLDERMVLVEKYNRVIAEKYTEKEFERLLDLCLEYDQVELYMSVASLKIYVNVLEEILSNGDGVEVKYAKELNAVSGDAENRLLEIRTYETNEQAYMKLAVDCKCYLGSEFYRHETDVEGLITPGEPLEADGFTLVYVNDAVTYIFTGHKY